MCFLPITSLIERLNFFRKALFTYKYLPSIFLTKIISDEESKIFF